MSSENHFFGQGILKLFPPPQYLTMPATGMDITDNTVRFLSLKTEKKGKLIEKRGDYKIPHGVVSHGKIVDKTKFIEILAQAKTEHNLSYIHVALPEEQAYVFQTTVPNKSFSDAELRTVLEFKLEENVPVSSRELVFDYEVIPNDGRSEAILNIVAFPLEIALDYADALHSAELRPLSFEIEVQAIARAVIPQHHGGTYMIVDFGKNRTGIAIVSEEILRFTSTVSVGGDSLSDAIQKHFDVDNEEADAIKNEKGFLRYKENKEVLETLISTVSVLRDEVRKHFNYWNSHAAENDINKGKIDKIILCGGGANLAGLAEYLASDMDVVVDVANVWTNTFSLNEFIPDIESRYSLAYATAVGLALKGM